MLRAQATRAQAETAGSGRGGGVGEEGMRQRTRAKELAGTTLDLELDHAIARHARTAEARVVYYTGTRERRHAREHTTVESKADSFPSTASKRTPSSPPTYESPALGNVTPSPSVSTSFSTVFTRNVSSTTASIP